MACVDGANGFCEAPAYILKLYIHLGGLPQLDPGKKWDNTEKIGVNLPAYKVE